MRMLLIMASVGVLVVASISTLADTLPLGLPPVPIPADNPQMPEKIDLGKKLYDDKRFSTTGEVGCVTCHDDTKVFTDSPLSVSEGVDKQTGTRNSPTVVNSVYMKTQFWDGRSPSLEDQALHPFINPIEHGLPDHEPILELVRTDPEYVAAFAAVFGKSDDEITMVEVTQAIAAFERTVISGDSPFDHWYFGGDADAMTPEQIRGFEVFVGQGRCVSCHVIEQTQAIFTDNRFHNIGIGINDIQDDVPDLAHSFKQAELTSTEVDQAVLTDARTSELGRFAVTRRFDDLGAFKTPTLRNIALTDPYMHDGSVEALIDVMFHYNNGGVTDEGDRVNDFLSGGIRPLNLSDEQIEDLVEFMDALTSPQFSQLTESSGQ